MSQLRPPLQKILDPPLPSVLTMLNDEYITITALVPSGCTSLVQPLDVLFNGPFKWAVDTIATSHMEAHVNDYLHGNFTASERRILLTKWIGQAWEEVLLTRIQWSRDSRNVEFLLQ